MANLEEIRQEIDELDQRLVELLGDRLELIKEVDVYKKAHGLPPLDEGRWQAVIAKRLEWAKTAGLEDTLIKEIFEAIHRWSLRQQNKNENEK